MNRWRELLTHLYFEKHARHSRARAFPLVQKLVRLLPNGIAFLLFNFGSTFRNQERPAEPKVVAPPPVPILEIGPGAAWPLNLTGQQRGLPYSGDVVERVIFRDYEFVEDPVEALREIHRVCVHDAEVRVEFTGHWSDPLQRRLGDGRTLASILDGPRGRELGLDALFTTGAVDEQSVALRVVKANGKAGHPSRIDVGCGSAKGAGYCGIDLFALPGVDLVCDIVKRGLPFSNDTIAAVRAIHFLEHVDDLVFVMNEIHRVCCDGALVDIEVPTLLGPWAPADPTHRRLFNARTFGYFTEEGNGGEGYAGITSRFELLNQIMSTTMRVTLRVRKSDTPTG